MLGVKRGPGNRPDGQKETGEMMECVIAYRQDSVERADNLKRVKAMWNSYGVVPAIVGSDDTNPWFHRTKYFNRALENIRDDILVFADADVMIDLPSLMECIRMIKDGYVMALPYRVMYDVPDLWKEHGPGVWRSYQSRLKPFISNGVVCGGLFAVNRIAFMDCGGFNEFMAGWGCEDQEQFYRISTIAGAVGRTNGILWHLSHPHVEDRRFTPYNQQELTKISNMGRDEVIKYVKSWPWRSQWVKDGIIYAE